MITEMLHLPFILVSRYQPSSVISKDEAIRVMKTIRYFEDLKMRDAEGAEKENDEEEKLRAESEQGEVYTSRHF